MLFFPFVMFIFGVVSGFQTFSAPKLQTLFQVPRPFLRFFDLWTLEVIAANSEVIGRSLEDDLFFLVGVSKDPKR